MVLDGVNAAVAVTVLNKPDIPPAVRTRGIVLAAFVPGILGMALPFVLARQSSGGQSGGNSGGTKSSGGAEDVFVPDVSGMHLDRAAAVLLLAKADLVPGTDVHAFSVDVDPNKVITQDPAAGTRVNLGSAVTLTVSDGQPPPRPAPVDIDADLTAKIQAVRTDLDARMDKLQANADASAATLQKILDAVNNPAKSGGGGPTTKS